MASNKASVLTHTMLYSFIFFVLGRICLEVYPAHDTGAVVMFGLCAMTLIWGVMSSFYLEEDRYGK